MLARMSKSSDATPGTLVSNNQPFKIVEFTRAEPPDGQTEAEWYRYVISQGRGAMSGLRQGTRESVTAAVEEIVARMNERRLGRFGRVHLRMGDGPKSDRAKR